MISTVMFIVNNFILVQYKRCNTLMFTRIANGISFNITFGIKTATAPDRSISMYGNYTSNIYGIQYYDTRLFLLYMNIINSDFHGFCLKTFSWRFVIFHI